MDLSLVYFPSAVTLGALHALEPGHAKTLTAAYLIGTKGTKRDALILGLSVALTHSAVVVLLCVAAVFVGREAFTGEASRYLALGSSVLVIALGAWLLDKRLRVLRRSGSTEGHDHHHSHAPAPVTIRGQKYQGKVEIIDTENGERFKVAMGKIVDSVTVTIVINRDDGRKETHSLVRDDFHRDVFTGVDAPAEPHQFSASITFAGIDTTETIDFEVEEPEHDHHHDHALMSDDEHARAHAASMPAYVARGERPTPGQIVAFGAAGGLVPCPAAISVMLLSLSLNQTGKGLLLVVGFGLGLAITLVGVGLIVVTGISKLASGGKFSRLSTYAPSIAAGMVMLSGSIGLLSTLIRGG